MQFPIPPPFLMSLSLSRPLAARELSPPSSPHHTCGYDVLAKLVEVGEGKFLKDDVGDIMACVATDHKPLRKSVKVRPGLKALQMMCMNAIFEKAQGRLQKQAKKITVSQLFRDVKDLSEVVRAQAVSAVGTAFSLSATAFGMGMGCDGICDGTMRVMELGREDVEAQGEGGVWVG